MVRSGTYREQVEFKASGGAAGGYITLQAYPGETPILSAPSGTYNDWISVYVENRSYIKIVGLTIANIHYTSGGWQKCLTRAGIKVKAKDNSHIEIRDNHIHELRGPGSPSMNSYIAGIQVIGTSDNENGGLIGLVIDNNLIHDVDVNNAEALQLKGNINGFEVTNNEIYSVDNILINTFGYDYSLTEQVRFQPRDGVIRDNYLHDSMSFGGCAGIYLNGGEDIVVEGNTVHDCFQGISINSETYSTPPYTAKNITVQNNLVYNNYMNGFSLGHMGDIVNILYRNNTIYQSGTAIMIGHVQQIKMVNNIFSIKASENLTSGDRSKVQFDYNLYYASGTSIDKSSLGANSIFANPQLVAPGSGNFHLEASSPAIDAGSSTPGEFAPTDFDGHPRPQGAGYDIGAYEYTGGVQPTNTPTTIPPTATPTPTPTPTPMVTSTPLPTNTPTPTNTPLPTSTPSRTMVRVFLPFISKRGVRGD
jgi:parallel beta-helix repeat protein